MSLQKKVIPYAVGPAVRFERRIDRCEVARPPEHDDAPALSSKDIRENDDSTSLIRVVLYEG